VKQDIFAHLVQTPQKNAQREHFLYQELLGVLVAQKVCNVQIIHNH